MFEFDSRSESSAESCEFLNLSNLLGSEDEALQTPSGIERNVKDLSNAESVSDGEGTAERETNSDIDETQELRRSFPNHPRSLLSLVENRGSILNTPIPSRFVAGRRRRHYTYRNRRKASPEKMTNLRRRRLAEANRIDNPFEQDRSCCVRYTCFAKVDAIHAFHWYRELKVMNREQYKSTLSSWYNHAKQQFEFDGNAVCYKFLNQGFGFSNNLISSVSGTNGAPAAQTNFAQPRDVRCRTLRNSIITFLKITSSGEGDIMPHRNFTNLPFPCRKVVFEKYVEYFNTHDPLRFYRSPPSITYFYGVWREYVPDVKTLKNTGFQKCAECVYYNEERARHILNPAALRELKEAAQQHFKDMARERQGYEMRKQLSCMDPQHYLSLVVDGADQSSYGLPHYLQKSKEDKGHKIAVKIVGVLIHGVENDLYLFSMVEGFDTGANHIIESVHRALDLKKKKMGRLPPTLFVQVDNCTRENKNRYFLGYLETLIALGVFVEIQMSSMEVGHTHTDVDQSFSCVHRRLDNHKALSLNQLHQQLEKSYAPTPHVEELDRVANFSTLCENSKSLTKVANFSQYRYFRLHRKSNQDREGIYITKCSVKRNLSDDWVDLPRSKDIGFLKTPPNILDFPNTKTRVPPNLREVNLCLRAAEARIRDESVMEELNYLRDRIYESHDYEGHWKSNSFELAGDYTPHAPRKSIESLLRNGWSSEGQTEGAFQRYNYSIGDFVAVKPERRYNTPFWVAEVLGFKHLDENGYVISLQVRWYTAGSGEDPLMVSYKPGFEGGEPWLAEVHVDTVMLRFDSLTRRNRLSRETATKLSRSLGTVS